MVSHICLTRDQTELRGWENVKKGAGELRGFPVASAPAHKTLFHNETQGA
jgi:hypothetical protein